MKFFDTILLLSSLILAVFCALNKAIGKTTKLVSRPCHAIPALFIAWKKKYIFHLVASYGTMILYHIFQWYIGLDIDRDLRGLGFSAGMKASWERFLTKTTTVSTFTSDRIQTSPCIQSIKLLGFTQLIACFTVAMWFH